MARRHASDSTGLKVEAATTDLLLWRRTESRQSERRAAGGVPRGADGLQGGQQPGCISKGPSVKPSLDS